jgi:hypothetical protein
VQKISRVRLQNKLLELFNCWQTNEKSGFRITPSAKMQLSKVVGNLHQLDIAGLHYTLVQFRNLVHTAFDPDFVWTTSRVQKTKQTLLGSNFYTIKNLPVQDESGAESVLKELYIRDQTILVEVPRYIYSIQIFSPSLEFTRDVKFDEATNQWFAGLRLFDD